MRSCGESAASFRSQSCIDQVVNLNCSSHIWLLYKKKAFIFNLTATFDSRNYTKYSMLGQHAMKFPDVVMSMDLSLYSTLNSLMHNNKTRNVSSVKYSPQLCLRLYFSSDLLQVIIFIVL